MKLITALFYLLIFCESAVSAPILEDIPPDCNNNKGLYIRSGSSLSAPPTWVELCKDLCVFDAGGKIISKKDVYFSRRSCDSEGRFILTTRCEKKEAEGCSRLVNSRFHDCYSNPGGEMLWRCTNRQIEVHCSSGESDKAQKYRANIGVGYCKKK